MIAPHDHTCARCGYQWHCALPQKPKAKRCPVDVAVSVNKGGPDCLLCHHLVMAARVAQARGLSAVAFSAAISVCWVEAMD